MKRFFCLTISLALTGFCFSQQIPANPNNRKTDSASETCTVCFNKIFTKAVQGSNYGESCDTIRLVHRT